MTKAQELHLLISRAEERMTELTQLPVDELTEEQSNELGTLETRHMKLKRQHRAALITEGAEEAEARAAFQDGDGESAEIRSLRGRTSIHDYMRPAVAGIGLTGAAAELNAALKVDLMGANGGVCLPYGFLEAQAPELRVDVVTTSAQLGGSTIQRPALWRIFGSQVTDVLGVRFDSVPAGISRWPLLTAGVAPVQTAEGAAGPDSVAAMFSTQDLKPRRLTGSYMYTAEQSLQLSEIEQYLRRDLGDAVKSAMQGQILSGDGTGANVRGFYTAYAAPTDAGAIATFSDYASLPAQGVDGALSMMESETSCLLGVDTYKHAASVYQTGSGQSGIEAIGKRGMMCATSSHVAAAVSGQSKGNLIHSGGVDSMIRGDTVAAVWAARGLELIRDIFSHAKQGVVTITWATFWDCYAGFRSDAYQRSAFKIS